MTSREFCYWLQGYFEINNNQPREPAFADSLNPEQVKAIRAHLALVFHHEIGPSYGEKKKQDALNKIHQGSSFSKVPNGDILLRC